MSPTDPKTKRTPASPGRPGLLYAGSKLFLVLAFIPVVLMIPGALAEDPDALLKAARRLPTYAWSAIGLATVSGVLLALHKLRSAKGPDRGEPRK